MSLFFESIVRRLNEVFDPTSLGELVAERLVDLIVGLIVFIIFYFLWRVIRLFLPTLLRRSGADAMSASFLETVIKYGLLTIGAINALDAVGFDTSAVLASLGIVGLTLGFAARDALSNLISGLLIFFDRPFVIGDLVEIEDHYGRVDRITLRSTRIVTRDGKMLAVPNSEAINKTVASYTNFPHLRLDIPVTVAVGENLERVRQALLNLVHKEADYLSDPEPRVVVTALNDYNVALELQAWLQDERKHVEKRFELREKVFNTLNEAGVDMPFETLALTPLEVKLAASNGSGALGQAAVA